MYFWRTVLNRTRQYYSKTDQAVLFTLNKLAFLINIMAERNVVFSQSCVHLQAFALLTHTAATSPSLHLCACTQRCTLRTIWSS